MKEIEQQLRRLKVSIEAKGLLNETSGFSIQATKQLDFLRYAQRSCQNMTYGACSTKYNGLNQSAAEKIWIPAKSAVLDYMVGEKPRKGASYYIAGFGYVATEIFFPESATDLADVC